MTAVIILVLALFINGATDAANSVMGIVSSGLMPLRTASLFAAAFDFSGMLFFTLLCPCVLESVSGLADFPAESGTLAVTASLTAVIIWSGMAWLAGIPTSESHGMLAGLTGACVALSPGFPDFSPWIPVAVGLLLSVILGALCGALSAGIIMKKSIRHPKGDLLVGCALTSFFHGAQDGQKFIALAVSCGILEKSVPTVFLCSAVMFFGTFFGGGRIVRKIGRDMADIDAPSALSGDFGSAAALLFLTACGFPVSTTHVRMSAAASASRRLGRHTDGSVMLEVAFCWITTFPACGFLAFLIIRLAELV